jgi:hypothetical protein
MASGMNGEIEAGLIPSPPLGARYRAGSAAIDA